MICLEKAQACLEENRQREAIAYYQQLLAHVELADVHVNVGALYRGEGDLAAALTHFRRALALKPDSDPAACNLGNVLSHLERAEEALALYDRAIGIAPDFAEPYANSLIPRLESCQWDRGEAAGSGFVFWATPSGPTTAAPSQRRFAKAATDSGT